MCLDCLRPFAIAVAVLGSGGTRGGLAVFSDRKVEDAFSILVGNLVDLLGSQVGEHLCCLCLTSRPRRFRVRVIGFPEDVVDAYGVDGLLAEPERLIYRT